MKLKKIIDECEEKGLNEIEIVDKGLVNLYDLQGLCTLRALYLGDNDFEVIPQEIGKLKNLQMLNLRDNDLVVLPEEIGHLPKLKELNISGNRLTILPPDISMLETNFVLIPGHKQALKIDGNPWIPPIADQLRLGVNHVLTYLKTSTYRVLYEKHMASLGSVENPIVPIRAKHKKLTHGKRK